MPFDVCDTYIAIILYLITLSYTLDSHINCVAAWKGKGKGLSLIGRCGTERRKGKGGKRDGEYEHS